jgi:hypothetical protein
MQYPLAERIGEPNLLVGREKEFKKFDKWIANIPRRLSKSRAILARRKSGKTAFVQRIFNKLWLENGQVIPFYFEFTDSKIWYPSLAIDYYCNFVSQYISFLERDDKYIYHPLSLDEIKQYGLKNSIEPLIRDTNFLLTNKETNNSQDLMWKLAISAPHRFAEFFGISFLVILDEFQYISEYVYPDPHYEKAPIESLPGTFHTLSESKFAPMFVTGSYASWLLKLINTYFQGGRLKQIEFSPYLTKEEGLEAVYKYAEYYQEPITNDTALQINELCMSDPFFIYSVIDSEYDDKDLTNSDSVVDTVDYEVSDSRAEMCLTWSEYIDDTLDKVNDQYAKKMLLHLNKYSDRYWSIYEIQQKLDIELSVEEIKKKLLILVASDLIERGTSDIQFKGLRDGTLNLIIRNRFEEEIKNFPPNLKQEFHEQIQDLKQKNRQLQGKINYLNGLLAENLVATAFRSTKRFSLSKFFNDVTDDTRLNIIEVKQRVPLQRPDGKAMEIDVMATSSDERVVVVEVKKTKTPIGQDAIEDFQEKLHQLQTDKILAAFLSLGGFTSSALEKCHEYGIANSDQIDQF